MGTSSPSLSLPSSSARSSTHRGRPVRHRRPRRVNIVYKGLLRTAHNLRNFINVSSFSSPHVSTMTCSLRSENNTSLYTIGTTFPNRTLNDDSLLMGLRHTHETSKLSRSCTRSTSLCSLTLHHLPVFLLLVSCPPCARSSKSAPCATTRVPHAKMTAFSSDKHICRHT